jgi:hypothetical protein
VGDGERLPEVTCIAEFDSNMPARDEGEPYSSLVVVWYQEQFAFPIGAGVLEEIRRLDWERDAWGWCW